MEVRLPLRLLRAKITVVQRLSQEHFRALVRSVRTARTHRKLLRQVLRSPDKPVLLDGQLVKIQLLKPKALVEEEARGATFPHGRPKGPALWVFVQWDETESNGGSSWPDLVEIERLRHAGLVPWALFLRKRGLIAYDQDWTVAHFPDRKEYLLRLPIDALQRIGDKAAVLVAAEKAVYADPTDFQNLGPVNPVAVFLKHLTDRRIHTPATPARPRWTVNPDSVQEARRMISLAIEEALRELEADVDVEKSDRGFASQQTLTARGYWPLVVLSHFLPRAGFIRPVFKRCQATGCGNEVHAPYRKYCSKQCYERQKKRNLRRHTRARKAYEKTR